MSALTKYRLETLDWNRRELTYALRRLDTAHDQSPRDEAVALLSVACCAERLASTCDRYDRWLQKQYAE